MADTRLRSRFRDGVMSFLVPEDAPRNVWYTPWETFPREIRPCTQHIKSLLEQGEQDDSDNIERLARVLTAKSPQYDHASVMNTGIPTMSVYWRVLCYQSPEKERTRARFAAVIRVTGEQMFAGVDLARAIGVLLDGPWGSVSARAVLGSAHAIVPEEGHSAAYAVLILDESAWHLYYAALSAGRYARSTETAGSILLTHPHPADVWELSEADIKLKIVYTLEFLVSPRAVFERERRALGLSPSPGQEPRGRGNGL